MRWFVPRDSNPAATHQSMVAVHSSWGGLADDEDIRFTPVVAVALQVVQRFALPGPDASVVSLQDRNYLGEGNDDADDVVV